MLSGSGEDISSSKIVDDDCVLLKAIRHWIVGGVFIMAAYIFLLPHQ
jgi:hypothetical protein